MGEALHLLYDAPTLALAKEGGDLFTFDRSIVDHAIERLHRAGRFSASLLATNEGRALIGENYRVLGDGVNAGLERAHASGLKHEVPPELTQALQDNTHVFAGWKAYHTMAEAGLSLVAPDGGAKPLSEFRKEAGEVFKRANLNLTAEYNHAVQSAQMAAAWNDIEQDGDRYDLQYRTAGDEKVRAEHQALDGTTLPPSDPFWSSYYPPNGWNCRCTAVQVRKGKYPRSDSAAATAAGDAATAKPAQRIFRYNAGTERRVFPEKHPYFPKGCDGCDGKLQLAKGKGRPECAACEIIRRQVDDAEVIPTKRGRVTCARGHGEKERAENIKIATYFAEKYGQQIELLPRAFDTKTADVYNATLGVEQEYKTNRTPTKGAIDNEIRKACTQAPNVVLRIESGISDEELRRGIRGRVNREKQLETLTIIRNGEDKTYTREQIMAEEFTL